MRLRAGFTLIELLVVISIIALLIGILLPVLGGVRSEGRRLVCATQLQQIGVGMHNFAVQNKDALPAAYTSAGGVISWDDAIGEFVGHKLTAAEAAAGNLPAERGAAVFTCPADPVVDLIPEAVRSYAMVRAGTDLGTGVTRGVGVVDDGTPQNATRFVLGAGDIPSPSDTIAVTERSTTSGSGFYNRQGAQANAEINRHLDQMPSPFRAHLLHGSEERLAVNYVFVDGHVAVFDPPSTIGNPASIGRPEGYWSRAAGD